MDKRLITVFSVFTVTSLFLFLRIGSISQSENLTQTAQSQSSYTLSFGKTRGKIYDCKMNPMVEEESRYLAACLPMPENMSAILKSPSLRTSKESLSSLMEKGKPFLAESTLPTLNIAGVEVFETHTRYASGQLAKHVIGYLDDSGNGLTGIEKSYNEYLAEGSSQSSITYKVDGRRNPLLGEEPIVNLAPINTKGVVLTIDSRIQKIAEEAGRKYLKKGAVVVMEPKTGKIRASASFPDYDLSNLSEAVNDTESSPLINRAFLAYNIGSTFKIATAAAALTQGFPAATEFSCYGKTEVLTQTFKCHRELGHGTVNMRQAMEGSCNPYFIQLGLKVDKPLFREIASDLSFGRPSVFADGFATASGYLPTEDDLFNPAAMANFSFGQGQLLGTPVQVAQMVCSVLNGGYTPPAILVEGTTQNGKTVEDKKISSLPEKAMSKWVADTIKSDLIGCVMEEPNQNATPNYVTAGGKTGTAQTGQFKENGEELLHCWFAGFFPAENPEYVVVVFAEDGESGNQNASPVFREIADMLYAPIKVPAQLAS